jgi:hypothetical protein
MQTAPAAVDVEAAAAAVEAELDAQEWNMQEIERIQEAQVRAPAPLLLLPAGTCPLRMRASCSRSCPELPCLLLLLAAGTRPLRMPAPCSRICP